MLTAHQRPSSIHSYESSDTFGQNVIPSHETDQQRKLRLALEQEAQRKSDAIDEDLKAEGVKMKRTRKEQIKLLLLGQAESGKSTLLKQFQLLHAPGTLEQERVSWRPVVYINIVRAIKRILEVLEEKDLRARNSPISPSSPNSPSANGSPSEAGDAYQNQLAQLRLRLKALLTTENALAAQIGSTDPSTGVVVVRSGWQRKGVGLKKLVSGVRASLDDRRASVDHSEPVSPISPQDDDFTNMLAVCRPDIEELWAHPAVRLRQEKGRLGLDDSAAFFLDSLGRIVRPGYIPTVEDVLRARVQTMGIAEHSFQVTIQSRTLKWTLYDVAGARGYRHTWVPYFDDANAIIYLAPISGYDQFLEEDGMVNRVDDSLQLWTSICSNDLLKKVHLVLFLNKTDILRAKLAAGISVKKYITSYGDRPQTYDDVSNYFRSHFTQVHRRHNPQRRVLYTHLTTVVDTNAMENIMMNVRDSIFRGYLKDAALV